MSLLAFVYIYIIFCIWCTVAVRCEPVCCTTSHYYFAECRPACQFCRLANFGPGSHFCPSWSEVIWSNGDFTEPICYGSKMCLKLGLLKKAPFAAVIAFIPTKKRRRRASSDTLYHPFEVHGGSGKQAVVFRCRYSSSCETCQIVASLWDREGTLAPDLPQSQSFPVFRRTSTVIFYFTRFMEIAALNYSSLLMAAFADAPAL